MGKTILIVDDEPFVVEALDFLMRQQEYTVVVTYDGEGALEEISKSRPDLILLDIMLPGIQGYEVCEIVKTTMDYQHIKVIFLTARGREEDIAKGLRLGADAYITKPYKNADVVAKVKELLEKKE